MIVTIGAFYQVKEVPFYPYLGESIVNGCWILSNALFMFMEMIRFFVSYSIKVYYIIRFVNGC